MSRAHVTVVAIDIHSLDSDGCTQTCVVNNSDGTEIAFDFRDEANIQRFAHLVMRLGFVDLPTDTNEIVGRHYVDDWKLRRLCGLLECAA